MSAICDADLQHLKPGKKVVLKSFNGATLPPDGTCDRDNYWKLVGAKATVIATSQDCSLVLIQFDNKLATLNLSSRIDTENALWVSVGDLKFVCRY